MFTLTHVYAKYYKAETRYEKRQTWWDLFTFTKRKKWKVKKKEQTKPQSESVKQST